MLAVFANEVTGEVKTGDQETRRSGVFFLFSKMNLLTSWPS